MKKIILLLFGPLISLLMLSFPHPEWMNPSSWRFISLLCWILVWWMTEVVPIAVTSLLPLVLFPVSGVMSEGQVAGHYSRPVIFLFMGGFFLAESLKKWNLHRRFAYFILYVFGTNIPGLLAGFMVATGSLSMWISNTATSIMMAAIGVSVIETVAAGGVCTRQQSRLFGTALMLSIAYSASVGGIATLVGTPPNLLFAGFVSENLNISVSMLDWMIKVSPFVLIMGICTWSAVVLNFSDIRKIPVRKIRDMLKSEKDSFNPLRIHEWSVICIFFLTAALWILRVPVTGYLGIELSDSTIAIAASLLLFCIPSSLSSRSFLLDWESARNIPWGILLMFGAGLSLATGFSETGLDVIIAEMLGTLTYLPDWAVLLILVTFAIFLTELISNTAAVAALLPLLLSISEALGIPFVYLAIPVTIVCSSAFMLPVATPPNAVAFSFSYFSVSEMAKFGFILNIIGILLVMILSLSGWF